LRRLTIDWLYIENSDLPEEARTKNVIILGGPDAVCTGDIVTSLLTEDEANLVRGDDTYHLFVKDSPWSEKRDIYILAGSDRIHTEMAAEEGIHQIIEKSRAEEWLHDPVEKISLEEARACIAQYQFVPDDEELPRDELLIEVSSDTSTYTPIIDSEHAKKDIERLFYLLSHGYCGYGYFKTKGDFEKAKSDILEELETSPTWSLEDFSELIHHHLKFMCDGHLEIGLHRYFTHTNFYCSKEIEIWKTEGEYYFVSDGNRWKIIKINERNADEFIFPSLNSSGDPVYIMGVLTETAPGPLTVTAEDTTGRTQSFRIGLYHLKFNGQPQPGDRIFEEKEISEIPVIVLRAFDDYYYNELEAFLETAEKYRGEPYLILDIRGNGGGNDEWARKWVEIFTGYTPAEYFAETAFISRTTLVGKINVFSSFFEKFPNNKAYKNYVEESEEELRTFEESHKTPYWSELSYPDVQMIPNHTKVYVLMDGNVGSSGESFIGYLRQVENVIFVGENSAGALMFGYYTWHQLPHSKLRVQVAFTLYFPIDLTFIEGRGLSPDLWIPAPDALDYVVAAIKKGIL